MRFGLPWLRRMAEKEPDCDVTAGSLDGKLDVGDQEPWPPEQSRLLRRVLNDVVTNDFVRQNWNMRGLEDIPRDEATVGGVMLVLRKGIRALVPQEEYQCTGCKEVYPEHAMRKADLCDWCSNLRELEETE